MGVGQLLPYIFDYTFEITGDDQVLYTWFPSPIPGPDSTTVTPPVKTQRHLLKGSGAVKGVIGLVPTGGDITLGAIQIYIIRDITTFPDGTITGTDTTKLTLANVPDTRKVYVSSSLTPTPSDVTADIDDRFDPEPFSNGFWLVATHGTSSGGTGTTELITKVTFDWLSTN